MSDELTHQSVSDQRGALQRYVIAWSDRERASALTVAAMERMNAERVEAWRYLRLHGTTDVELLDGSAWRVFADDAGIIVVRVGDV